MKKVALFLILSVFLLFGTAYGKMSRYKIYLTKSDTEAAAGVTEVELSVVTAFNVEFSGQKRADENPWLPSSTDGGLALIQLGGVSPSQAGAQGMSPLAGASLYLRTNMDAWVTSGGTPITTIPIAVNVPISGITRRFWTFYMPPTRYNQILLETGTSKYSDVTGYVLTGLDPAQWPNPKRVCVSGSSFYVNANSGVSLSSGVTHPAYADWTVPSWAQVAILYTGGDSSRFSLDPNHEPRSSSGGLLEEGTIWEMDAQKAIEIGFIGDAGSGNAQLRWEYCTQ